MQFYRIKTVIFYMNSRKREQEVVLKEVKTFIGPTKEEEVNFR